MTNSLRWFRCGFVAIALLVATALFACGAHAKFGTYDATYGSSGNFSALISPVSARDTSSTRSVVTADQRLVVATECTYSSKTAFCLVRFNADGSKDMSFGSTLSTNGGSFGPNLHLDVNKVTGLAIDPTTQSFVVGGECRPPGATRRTICVTRFLQNGNHDTTFASYSGIPAAPPAFANVNAKAGRLRVATNSKIYMAAGCPIGPAADNMNMCVLALNADGTPDVAFAGTGNSGVRVLTQLANQVVEYATDLTLLADGSMVYVGSCKADFMPGIRHKICYGNLSANGVDDPARGRLFASDYDDYPTQVMATNDGKLLIAGYAFDRATGWSTTMFTRVTYSRGGLGAIVDATFGSNGRLTAATPTMFQSIPSLSFALASDQEIFEHSVTYTNPIGTHVANITVRRSDGVVRASAAFEVGGRYGDVVLEDAGKVLVSGRTGTGISDTDGRFYVARLVNDDVARYGCTMDIDGDGKVLASTDGLLLTRILLGLRGSVVTAGAVGAGATRSDWFAVSRYMVNHCKMKLVL